MKKRIQKKKIKTLDISVFEKNWEQLPVMYRNNLYKKIKERLNINLSRIKAIEIHIEDNFVDVELYNSATSVVLNNFFKK